MKNFKITLVNGLCIEMKAENEEELLSKLSTGLYGIMPIRGKTQVKINSENTLKIEEIID